GSVSTDLAFPFQPPPANGDANGEHSILLDLVPNNVFNALASGQTIQVLLFCLLFGLAMGKIPQPSSMSLSQALNAVYRACTVLTNWFAWGLPFATFILIADQTASTGTRPLTLMGGYL
ncbi:cation:dicarboxylase symporter family transporter, partial [Mesorhizobium sp. M4B.F.Ca.ET.215.01.1.1]